MGVTSGMSKKGTIRSWNDQKGYGFIQPNGGGQRDRDRAKGDAVGDLLGVAVAAGPEPW
jgi:hypothetical protein